MKNNSDLVLNYIRENPKTKINKSIIAFNLKMSRQAVDRNLKYLIESGIIAFDNKTKLVEFTGKPPVESPFVVNHNRKASIFIPKVIIPIKRLFIKMVLMLGIGCRYMDYVKILSILYIKEYKLFISDVRVEYQLMYEVLNTQVSFGVVSLYDDINKIIIQIRLSNKPSNTSPQKEDDTRDSMSLYTYAAAHGIEHMVVVYITSYMSNPLNFEYYKITD